MNLNLIGYLIGKESELVTIIETDNKTIFDCKLACNLLDDEEFKSKYVNRSIKNIDYCDNSESYLIYLSDEDITNKYDKFEIELTELLNKHSLENYSNTPDYIISRFLVMSLQSFENSIKLRDYWYNFEPHKYTIEETKEKQKSILFEVAVKVTDSEKFEKFISLINDLQENIEIPLSIREQLKENIKKILDEEDEIENTMEDNNETSKCHE